MAGVSSSAPPSMNKKVIRVSAVLALAFAGIVGALVFQYKSAQRNLRDQVRRMAEERSHWGEIMMKHLKQRLQDAVLGNPYTTGSSARRIESADRVFKSWAQLAAFTKDMLKIIDANPSTSPDVINANRAQIRQLTSKYREAGEIWEVPPGTVVYIVAYYDKSGESTQPRAKDDLLTAADGDLLFAKVSWGGIEGYMALYRTQ